MYPTFYGFDNMTKALVLTGCSGFIGYNFLKHFIETEKQLNYEYILSIDKLGPETKLVKDDYLNLCHTNGIETYNGSIGMLSVSTHGVLAKQKIINHDEVYVLDFASSSHVDVSIQKPDDIFRENSLTTSHLVGLLGHENITTFYHISTDEVYGDLDLSVKGTTEGKFFTDSQYRPSNPYSASKVAQDVYLESMSRTFGLKTVLIRMANQFGPYQYYEKMIPATLKRVLNKQKIKIYGDGENCRQWTFVEDTVKIISEILTNTSNDPYKVIHLADEMSLLSNNELIELIGKELDKRKIKYEIEYVKDRPGHDRMYCLSVDHDIQDQYKIRFAEALEKTIDYYVEVFADV